MWGGCQWDPSGAFKAGLSLIAQTLKIKDGVQGPEGLALGPFRQPLDMP